MVDKPRLSIASSVGFKGVAATAAHFKQLFNPPSSSSLVKVLLQRLILFFCIYSFFFLQY